jgi:hypothetical protein
MFFLSLHLIILSQLYLYALQNNGCPELANFYLFHDLLSVVQIKELSARPMLPSKFCQDLLYNKCIGIMNILLSCVSHERIRLVYSALLLTFSFYNLHNAMSCTQKNTCHNCWIHVAILMQLELLFRPVTAFSVNIITELNVWAFHEVLF